jgi:putative phosphoesterase
MHAVLSDIHANPWALEEVLKDIADVDRIIVLGDIVGIGPRPREVIEILMDDDRVIKVKGNHDHNTIHGTELGPTDIVPRKPHHDWVRSQLSAEHLDYLEAPVSLNLDNGMNLAIMHSHPDDMGSKVPFFHHPYPEVLDDFYSDIVSDVVLFGHTHLPLDVIGKDGRRYVNPGAVGAQNMGSAEYVLIDTENETIQFRTARYDIGPVKSDLKEKEVPYWQYIARLFYNDGAFHR